VVLKAMAKEPSGRYATAQDLADDLQRFLKDEPIRARRPSLVQRARKWARRHQAVVWAAAVCLSVTLLVLAVSIGWAVRDRDARWATTAGQVNRALKEATVLQGQRKWREALGAVTRAEALLANSGGDAALHNRAKELREDLKMAGRLDHLRLQSSHGPDASFRVGDTRAATAYATEFERYGIGVLTAPPERVAASIQARTIHEELVAALDDWILVQTDAGVREHLRAIAERADANKWRSRMRTAVVQNDRPALEELASRPEVADFVPATAHLLGVALAHAGAGPRAVQVLTAAQQRHPQDFWLNYQLGIQFLWGPGVQHNAGAAAGYLRAALVARPDYPTVYTYLGIALQGPEHLDEKIALNRKAIELDPDYYSAHGNLGLALLKKGKSVEAEARFREVLRLRPEEPRAHVMLGNALRDQGRLAEAEVEHREALRRRPGYPEAHIGLGLARLEQGKSVEAEVEFREALRLKRDLPEAHYNLGVALVKQERPAEAEAEFQEALRLRPDFPKAHCNLGAALAAQGKYAEAEAEFREALHLKADYPEAHCNLGHSLGKQGRFAEALKALRRGHELGSRQPKWRYPSAEWVRDAELAAALDAKLSLVLQGQAQPAGAVERLALARLCQEHRKRYAAAARFYAEAFAAEPGLANDLRHPHRYNLGAVAAVGAEQFPGTRQLSAGPAEGAEGRGPLCPDLVLRSCGRPPLEVKRRVEQLLAKFGAADDLPPDGGWLQALRGGPKLCQELRRRSGCRSTKSISPKPLGEENGWWVTPQGDRPGGRRTESPRPRPAVLDPGGARGVHRPAAEGAARRPAQGGAGGAGQTGAPRSPSPPDSEEAAAGRRAVLLLFRPAVRFRRHQLEARRERPGSEDVHQGLHLPLGEAAGDLTVLADGGVDRRGRDDQLV
jgi:tetratricopeptide (TPR) repeat protein